MVRKFFFLRNPLLTPAKIMHDYYLCIRDGKVWLDAADAAVAVVVALVVVVAVVVALVVVVAVVVAAIASPF